MDPAAEVRRLRAILEALGYGDIPAPPRFAVGSMVQATRADGSALPGAARVTTRTWNPWEVTWIYEVDWGPEADWSQGIATFYPESWVEAGPSPAAAPSPAE